MNSRQKGKVSEREYDAIMRGNGFDAQRGQLMALYVRLHNFLWLPQKMSGWLATISDMAQLGLFACDQP
jgi:hypothetical protein